MSFGLALAAGSLWKLPKCFRRRMAYRQPMQASTNPALVDNNQ